MIASPLLSEFEIATGMVFGVDDDRSTLPDPDGSTPLQALERELLPALLRPPCMVSFSGGRDSSAVLAAAVKLAKREGLAPPIPVTNVFPEVREADEDEWQQHVVRHLGLTEWLRLQHTDELDLLGPYAQRVLLRHGLVWPFNVHFHLPLLDAARGGSMLTGIGGDELFGAAQRERTAALIAGQLRPRARDLLRVGLALSPHLVRRIVLTRRQPVELPWLRPRAQRRLRGMLAAWSADAPRGLTRRLAWVRSSRYLEVATTALERTAHDTDVLLVHPLLSVRLWAQVAKAAMPLGFVGRSDGMRRLFGDLLPDDICTRTSKALFDDAFWTARTRDCLSSLSGAGVPDEWVDRAALAEHWQQEHPLANSFTLLQAGWLASRQGVEHAFHDVGTRVPPSRASQRHERQRAQLDEGVGLGRVQG